MVNSVVCVIVGQGARFEKYKRTHRKNTGNWGVTFVCILIPDSFRCQSTIGGYPSEGGCCCDCLSHGSHYAAHSIQHEEDKASSLDTLGILPSIHHFSVTHCSTQGSCLNLSLISCLCWCQLFCPYQAD